MISEAEYRERAALLVPGVRMADINWDGLREVFGAGTCTMAELGAHLAEIGRKLRERES